jgi:hypothetical protein
VTHPEKAEIMKNTRKNFFIPANEYDLDLKPVRQFYNSKGEVVYELYPSQAH